MSGSKRSYTCAWCGVSIIAVITDEGTVPHIISPCVRRDCDGQMWNDYKNIAQLTGTEPTHHLARNPDAKTDKLELKILATNE